MTSRLVSKNTFKKVNNSTSILRSTNSQKIVSRCPFTKFNEKSVSNIFSSGYTDFDLQALHHTRVQKDGVAKKILKDLEDSNNVNKIIPGLDKLGFGKNSGQSKEAPGGPQPPAPSGDIFKKISQELKRNLAESDIFINRPGYFPEQLDKYIHDDVVVKITCHLRDYYDKRDQLQNLTNDGPPKLQEMKKKARKSKDKSERERAKKHDELQEKMNEVMKKIAQLDPTGSSQALFDKDKRYTYLKFQGKDALKEEMKSIGVFVKMNLMDYQTELQNHSTDVDAFTIHSKVKFQSNCDMVSMTMDKIDLRFYMDFTVDRNTKKITKIEVTDVKKGKSAKDSIKDAINSMNKGKVE